MKTAEQATGSKVNYKAWFMMDLTSDASKFKPEKKCFANTTYSVLHRLLSYSTLLTGKLS